MSKSNKSTKGPRLFYPAAAAKYLGISSEMLTYYRLTGRVGYVEDIEEDTEDKKARRTTIYTQEQLDEAREKLPRRQNGGRKTADGTPGLVQ